MALLWGKGAAVDSRVDPRDAVDHRTRIVRAGGQAAEARIVNLSPHGLMARCDTPVAEGERVTIALPGLGSVAAEVRWALGGRIGCQFETAVADAAYPQLLAALHGGAGR